LRLSQRYRRFSRVNGRGGTSRNALARLVARACGLLPIALRSKRKAAGHRKVTSRHHVDGEFRTRLRKRGTRLGWRCRWKPSLRRLRGDNGRSGTHEQCGPGWLAPGRIRIFGRNLLASISTDEPCLVLIFVFYSPRLSARDASASPSGLTRRGVRPGLCIRQLFFISWRFFQRTHIAFTSTLGIVFGLRN
jgi:hypothetical protein